MSAKAVVEGDEALAAVGLLSLRFLQGGDQEDHSLLGHATAGRGSDLGVEAYPQISGQLGVVRRDDPISRGRATAQRQGH